MSTLIIVESPAKAKKIGQLLGKDYIVKASVGHIYELSKIEEDFEPNYEIIKGKSKVLLRACSIEVTKYLSKFTLAKQGETLTLG